MFERGQFLALWLIIWKRQLGSISSSDPDRHIPLHELVSSLNFICLQEGSFFLFYFINIRIFLAIQFPIEFYYDELIFFSFITLTF